MKLRALLSALLIVTLLMPSVALAEEEAELQDLFTEEVTSVAYEEAMTEPKDGIELSLEEDGQVTSEDIYTPEIKLSSEPVDAIVEETTGINLFDITILDMQSDNIDLSSDEFATSNDTDLVVNNSNETLSEEDDEVTVGAVDEETGEVGFSQDEFNPTENGSNYNEINEAVETFESDAINAADSLFAAGSTYTVNGKQVYATMVDDPGNGQCWAYANSIYKIIWGVNFDSSFAGNAVTGQNMLRNLNDNDRSLTASHLQAFVSQAPLGSVIRIGGCTSSCSYWYNDSLTCGHKGHSLVIVAKSDTGFTTLDRITGYGRRENTWTWASFCSWFSSYPYIKYIKWPNASVFNGTKIQFWGFDNNSKWTGVNSFWAKRFDSDSNHFARYYLDDELITGHMSSDDNGFFSHKINTAEFTNGTHKLSVYYANTNGGSWDHRTVIFENDPFLDLNGFLDGKKEGGLENYGTVDVYINGHKVADDVVDYYTQWPAGTIFEIKDIKANKGFAYQGIYNGSLSGKIGPNTTNVVLTFVTQVSSIDTSDSGRANNPATTTETTARTTEQTSTSQVTPANTDTGSTTSVTPTKEETPVSTEAPSEDKASLTIDATKKSNKATITAAPGTVYQLDLGGASGKKFKSSKKKVATVSSAGLVTVKGAGKAKITFKVGKKTRTVTLTVKDPTIPSRVTLSVRRTSVRKGDADAVTATLPEGTYSGIKWTSSNKKIATVDKYGYVEFKKAGKVTITATATRGKKKARVKFTVSK